MRYIDPVSRGSLRIGTVTDRAAQIAEHAANRRLDLAALGVARFAHPTLDEGEILDRLDQLAGEVSGDTHLALRRVIGIRHGIGGNVDDYSNPDNSYLNRVLETRRGIPISLSVLWMEVGRRAGIDMQGVGLPGHFVVYAGGQMVDPFHYGEAIGFDEAAALIANALGGEPRLDKRWLEPVDGPDIVRRMVRNLLNHYEQHGPVPDWIPTCLTALTQ